MSIKDIYRKLRQGKTLTGDECAALEEFESWPAQKGAPVSSVYDLPMARAMWAADGRAVER